MARITVNTKFLIILIHMVCINYVYGIRHEVKWNKKANNSFKSSPIVQYICMADPHIFIYTNKAYLYSTRDIDSIQTKTKFVMPDWDIWSSDDLIHSKYEKSWCDGLINQQIHDPSDPARHGAFYCVASKNDEQVSIQKGKRMSISKSEGIIKVESKTKFNLEKDFPARRFNLVSGFEVLPISVSFTKSQTTNIKIITKQ